MKEPGTYLLLVLGLTSFPIKGFAESCLVEHGQPRAEIILAERPARAAQLGAFELQTYVEKITGATLAIVSKPTGEVPVKIYVGESEAARQVGVNADGLERDAFHMVSGPNWLALVGNDLEFTPREPWARHHGEWLREKQQQWEQYKDQQGGADIKKPLIPAIGCICNGFKVN